MKAKSGAYRSAKKNNNSAGKKRFSPALRGHDKRPTKREKEKKEEKSYTLDKIMWEMLKDKGEMRLG